MAYTASFRRTRPSGDYDRPRRPCATMRESPAKTKRSNCPACSQPPATCSSCWAKNAANCRRAKAAQIFRKSLNVARGLKRLSQAPLLGVRAKEKVQPSLTPRFRRRATCSAPCSSCPYLVRRWSESADFTWAKFRPLGFSLSEVALIRNNGLVEADATPLASGIVSLCTARK